MSNMSDIKVHLFNIHGPITKINIALENTSVNPPTYFIFDDRNYLVSERHFTTKKLDFNVLKNRASSEFTFNIEADPKYIVNRCNAWKYENMHTTQTNGATQAQWFLTKFCHIPEPSFLSTPVSFNHLFMGIFLPSFLPTGLNLAGRVMDNAKFHIDARNHPELSAQYSWLYLNSCLALTALITTASIAGIILSALTLSGGLLIPVAGTCVVTGAVGTYGFFSTLNKRSSKLLTEQPVVIQNDNCDYDDDDENDPITNIIDGFEELNTIFGEMAEPRDNSGGSVYSRGRYNRRNESSGPAQFPGKGYQMDTEASYGDEDVREKRLARMAPINPCG